VNKDCKKAVIRPVPFSRYYSSISLETLKRTKTILLAVLVICRLEVASVVCRPE
jgi:hypothetical protein